ncbi:hypothetical protein F5148DRAFT_1287032 [Russula earlei]|uniref:Uncharacterized protein n=1 Tax=Russula earlei TaxID=71964 RepID=A0ACC0U394_9AGAM|nr:hypothetical protein F5148DRAFT_1287032 [Russula earlei]
MPCGSPSSTTIGGSSDLEAAWKEQDRACCPDSVTINTLPDDVLLDIFYFFMARCRVCIATSAEPETCLQGKRPISEMPYVSSALPVVISLAIYDPPYPNPNPSLDPFWSNTAASLQSEYCHRICEIDLSDVPGSQMEILAAAMQKPFPQLTHLRICAGYSKRMSLSDLFLGGSAPLLRHVELRKCSFPGIPKLLLSANRLVTLCVQNIPYSGYISSQTLIPVLSVMDSLESLRLGFDHFFHHRPDPGGRPSPTRSVLPALTELGFKGFHKYSEELLAQSSESPGQQFSSLAQLCSPSLLLPSTLIQLHIRDPDLSNQRVYWDHEATQCLEFLDLFITVKDLYLTEPVGRHVCRVLEGLAEERATEALPTLQNIFLRHFRSLESAPNSIKRFIAARQLSGRPVDVYPWGPVGQDR